MKDALTNGNKELSAYRLKFANLRWNRDEMVTSLQPLSTNVGCALNEVSTASSEDVENMSKESDSQLSLGLKGSLKNSGMKLR